MASADRPKSLLSLDIAAGPGVATSHRMTRTWLLVLLLGACEVTASSTPSPRPGGKADDPHAQPARGGVQLVDDVDFAAVQDLQCSSGRHRVGTYAVASFDAGAAREALAAHDLEGLGCPGRTYSRSKRDAQTVARDLATSWESMHEDLTECGSGKATDFLALVDDETNVAVFSAVYDPEGPDDPVVCNMAEIVIYRANGTVLWFDYDYSD
jgi:hypothetical protein